MSKKPSQEHIDLEALSMLLDATGTDGAASAHLNECEECRSEFERLSHMRMALSGLGELNPPADGWMKIEQALEAREVDRTPGTIVPQIGTGLVREERISSGRSDRVRILLGILGRWPVQIAAGFLLFAAGIVSGLQITGIVPLNRSGELGQRPEVVKLSNPGVPTVAGTAASEPSGSAYLDAVTELVQLRQPRFASQGGQLEPAAAAEQLARLQGLIDASREALDKAPADPVANSLLFQLVEERDYLAHRLNQSLRLVTLEYR